MTTVTITDATGQTRTLTVEAFRSERGWPRELYGDDPAVMAQRRKGARKGRHSYHDNTPCIYCGRAFTWKPARIRHQGACPKRRA